MAKTLKINKEIAIQNYEKIKATRKDLDVSQKAVAEVTGIDPKTLSRKLHNPETFTANELYALAQYYDTSVDYLLGITDNPIQNVTSGLICEATGLSRDAVRKLQSLSNNSDHKNAVDALNWFIENEDFIKFAENMENYVEMDTKIFQHDLLDYLLNMIAQKIRTVDMKSEKAEPSSPCGSRMRNLEKVTILQQIAVDVGLWDSSDLKEVLPPSNLRMTRDDLGIFHKFTTSCNDCLKEKYASSYALMGGISAMLDDVATQREKDIINDLTENAYDQILGKIEPQIHNAYDKAGFDIIDLESDLENFRRHKFSTAEKIKESLL